MSTMQTELYDALIDAGASETKARDAATAAAAVVADYPKADEVATKSYIEGKETAIKSDIEGKIERINSKIEEINRKIERINGKIEKLEWMSGAIIALVIGVLLAVLFQ